MWESPQVTVTVGAAVSGTKYALMHNTKTGAYLRKHMTVDKGNYTFEVQTMCTAGKNHRANVKVGSRAAETGGTPAHGSTFWTNNVIPFVVDADQTEIQLFIYSYFLDNDVYLDDFILYKEEASAVKNVEEKIFTVSRLQNNQYEITGTTSFRGYEICDISGRTVQMSSEPAISYRLNLSEMTKGIYVLKVTGEQGMHQVQKLICN
ncbi:hypothetical protein SDC9_172102 [bioreactor metagenome]|uniref:Secretion system C-terminal sorting domain-containing protein n=1 Tax=bioreactor metagenome TaxID=1076179 RepID=A0A645GF28_9ZZZZ